MDSKKIILIVFLCITSSIASLSQSLTQWQDNKYSMFIHFGLYSELGGVWDNHNIDRGYSEQIQSHAGIYSDTYAQVATHFVPSKWNADSVVLLAKQAGMRSIVITSKHHDGFCMFKTQTTDFNIVDATPFKRDVVKELSDACKRHGLNFGLYFSLIDWHYPQAYPISSHNADFITPEHHEYSKKQLTELLTNYGSISELWFDMGSLTYKQSSELRDLVKKYQPGCLISGRLGNDQGDFCVMGDNEYPDFVIDAPWQVPASMYDETWGYRSWQKHVSFDDKSSQKLASLVKTVARGGNYLLNIGPKGDGSVVDFEKDVLLEMGEWLKVNGEALYGTRPITSIHVSSGNEVTVKGNKLYVIVFENDVELKGIPSKIKRVYPLDTPSQKIKYRVDGNSLHMSVPQTNILRVVVVETAENIPVKSKRPSALKSSVTLNSLNAQHHYSFSGTDYYSSYRSTTQLSWDVQSSVTKKVKPVIFYSDEEKGRDAVLSINGTPTPVSFKDGETVTLNNKGVKWGKVSISPSKYGFIHQVDTNPKELTETDWTANKSYHEGAMMFQNKYWIQEVTAPSAMQVLVRIPNNDGLAVYLNDQEIYIINDHLQQATVLLPLKAGTNKLLIKYFNRFAKDLEMGVFTDVPQNLYKKTLPEVSLGKNKTYEIDLRLPSQFPVHQNVHAPNFSIQFAN